MARDFFRQLTDELLLRQAWHLARNDARKGFIYDTCRYSDFGAQLEGHLSGLATALRNSSYHPRPAMYIDVPKSSLSVRPGTQLEIEDLIVLFGIAKLIAPPLDKKLPEGVYSWRVKQRADKRDLFEESEDFLKLPFLKRETVRRLIEIEEPWYEAWPEFVEDVRFAYEEEGYQYLVTSDIVAYFENIDLYLLRDILLQALPKQPRIINFLINILEYWTWPGVHGASVPRGIPQGNGVSSFLGNVYLLPLDKVFARRARSADIRYFRYMDDVRVLTKDLATAKKVLFLMNDTLRELRLNIQGSKTRILHGQEIREELIDDRLSAVNRILEEMRKKGTLTVAERDNYIVESRQLLRRVKGKRSTMEGKELRLFRRLMTVFSHLNNSAAVAPLLSQLERNPDARLVRSAAAYLRGRDRSTKATGKLLALLRKRDQLFPFQTAYLLTMLRYMRDLPPSTWKIARQVLNARREHWYVRQQAALLLSKRTFGGKELQAFRRRFENERNSEVRRALAQLLCQQEPGEIAEVASKLIFSAEPKQERLGHHFYALMQDRAKGIAQVASLLQNFHEERLLEHFFELELLSRAVDPTVRKRVYEGLLEHKQEIRHPLVQQRVTNLLKRLRAERPRGVAAG